MISLGQLFFKDLGIDDGLTYNQSSKSWKKPEIECCILHTMVYEESIIEPLIRTGIPITVFRDSPQEQSGVPIIEYSPDYKNI